ncbi:MAG: Hsp20 family protein [Opitutaceae bacterium]
MHPIINAVPTLNRRTKAAAPASTDASREPAYECQDHGDVMTLVVYVPGVSAAGVEIEGRGADLTVTARKAHFVRVNFAALHLEGAQRDYRLRLRLGTGLDYSAMSAEIAGGVLTVTLPKLSRVLGTASLAHAA